MKILIGVTSSIAAYRIPNLVSQLKKEGHEIITMISEAAKSFVTPQSLAVISEHRCYTDADEWNNTNEVVHIKLAKWCDVCLVAPITANSLAKMANGICDNLLTSTIRALGKTPLVVAPAMNTRMWNNRITADHIAAIKKYYTLSVISPVEKVLADGDEGIGGLAEDNTIIEFLKNI